MVAGEACGSGTSTRPPAGFVTLVAVARPVGAPKVTGTDASGAAGRRLGFGFSPVGFSVAAGVAASGARCATASGEWAPGAAGAGRNQIAMITAAIRTPAGTNSVGIHDRRAPAGSFSLLSTRRRKPGGG